MHQYNTNNNERKFDVDTPRQQVLPQLRKHVFVMQTQLAPHQTRMYQSPNCFFLILTF